MDPIRLTPDHAHLPATLALIQRVFAEHDGRIDPPSSMHRLTLQDLKQQARAGEIWVIGTPPQACVILSARDTAVYVSKLTVAPERRGMGWARRLIALAEDRARAFGLSALEVQSRIELTENHALFEKLGFERGRETAHPGYARPTSVRYRKAL